MDDSDINGFPGEYDPATDIYRVFYDPDSPEPVTTMVVQTVAALTDTPPTALDPLYEILNPDALNDLYPFDPQRGSASSDDHVMFTYHECEVRVFSTGVLEFDPPADS